MLLAARPSTPWVVTMTPEQACLMTWPIVRE